ncbi:MAG: hypothetical protein QG670_442 [Thermoproteota archaeon]|nr:hypothetical protein [Thermoproteota archaeon]
MIKMTKKRNYLEISADLLRVAKEGARKSHLVYKANLNFSIIETYLKRLQETGLITVPSDDHLFKTTLKGEEYLNQYMKLTDIFTV